MGDSIFNLGDMLDAVGRELGPDSPALIHGERVISWPDMTARSNNVARNLRARGVETGDKAGFYLRNQPEYTEALVACFKGRFTHVNVNYRYLEDELVYIFDNSDSAVVFFDREFRDNVERVKDRLPNVKVWVEIGGDGSDTPDYAIAYEDLAAEGDGSELGIERSDDDLLFLYTGGTTGMPKGVMWSHRIWRESSRESMIKIYGFTPENMDQHIAWTHEAGKLSRQLPACPLMHGTGLFTAMGSIISGGCIVTLENTKKFDPEELWETVDRNG
ncbi:MAG: AMP-binding protein, partial [Henriciella sp.]|uniref:AMP-binding protein n=1 Tax=Henriciella sp. TaxID=1968823 RepID=UPI003C751C03